MTIDSILFNQSWQDFIGNGRTFDSVITDPPYSKTTHDGEQADRHDDASTRPLNYAHWSRYDLTDLIGAFAPRVRKWFAVMTSHDHIDAATMAMATRGLTTFAPVPILFPDSVRLQGDGPASAAVYLVVGRTKRAHKWRSLPGYYIAKSRERGAPITGAKPLDLMRAVVNDYSDPGDLVCDPCAGWGTTLLAAAQTGRRAVGCELNVETHAAAVERLANRAELFR